MMLIHIGLENCHGGSVAFTIAFAIGIFIQAWDVCMKGHDVCLNTYRMLPDVGTYGATPLYVWSTPAECFTAKH